MFGVQCSFLFAALQAQSQHSPQIAERTTSGRPYYRHQRGHGRTWRPPKAQAQLLLSPGAPPASLSPRQASPLQCRVVTSCDYDDLDKVPTVDLAPSAPDASDDAASAASTTLASDMAALLPWLGVLLFSQWTKPRSRLSRRRGSGCQLLQTAPPYHTENLAPCGNNGPCCWPRPRLTRRQCCNYSFFGKHFYRSDQPKTADGRPPRRGLTGTGPRREVKAGAGSSR